MLLTNHAQERVDQPPYSGLRYMDPSDDLGDDLEPSIDADPVETVLESLVDLLYGPVDEPNREKPEDILKTPVVTLWVNWGERFEDGVSDG